MSWDLALPFGILLTLVIYLIFTRSKFEQDMVKLYEEKFELWKKQNTHDTTKVSHKELVGLVFEKDYKLSIELFKNNAKDRLQKGKFSISE